MLGSSNKRYIELPNVTRSICELYLHCIHFGTVPLWQDKVAFDDQYHREEMGVALVELYSMGDMLSDKQTMDTAVSGFIEVFNGSSRPMLAVLPGVACITRAYGITKPASKLKLLMVKMYVRKACLAETNDDLPQPFLADLARAALKRVDDLEKGDLRLKPALVECQYHEHAIGDRCPSRRTKKRKHSGVTDDARESAELDGAPPFGDTSPVSMVSEDQT